MAISAKDVQSLRKRTGAGIMDCKKALTESGGDQEVAIKLLKEWGIAKAAKKSGREASEGVLAIAFSDDKKQGVLVEVNCETDFVANTDEYKKYAQDLAEFLFNKGYTNSENFDEETENKVKEGIAQFKENMIISSLKRIETTGKLYHYIHTDFKKATVVGVESTGNVDVLGKDLAVHMTANQVSAISENEMDPKIIETKKEEFAEELTKQGKPENMIGKIVEGKLKKFFKDETLLFQPFLKNEDLTVKEHINSVAKEIGAEIKLTNFVKTIIGA